MIQLKTSVAASHSLITSYSCRRRSRTDSVFAVFVSACRRVVMSKSGGEQQITVEERAKGLFSCAPPEKKNPVRVDILT